MKWYRKSVLVGLTVVAVMVVGIYLLGLNWRPGKSVYNDQVVHVREEFGPAQLINIHASADRVMYVGGHRYANVRGYAPFYISDGKDSVLFACGDSKRVTVYEVNVRSGNTRRASVENTAFGMHIGLKGGMEGDSVKWIDGDVAELTCRGIDWIEAAKVDFRTGEAIGRQFRFLNE